ncbi:MAG: hypothetical protein H0U29_06720 [Acidimicrobiia bacterium]|nr:hypothetical protein [Acidimicrobiia bacterium]
MVLLPEVLTLDVVTGPGFFDESDDPELHAALTRESTKTPPSNARRWLEAPVHMVHPLQPSRRSRTAGVPGKYQREGRR